MVAFPTETVYGLGANATDEAAVRRVYAAKGRPSNNPMIVHVSSTDAAQRWTRSWPEAAQRLAEEFWPGPLTMVLPVAPGIAPSVLAGGDTVAIRIPAHPVALDLLRACDFPIAAPSANRSGQLSPTTAAAVIAAMPNQLDLVLDGGPCDVGVESTVISLVGERPMILRPGMILRDQIARALGWTLEELAIARVRNDGGALPSPGLLERHYAPRIPLVLHPKPHGEAGPNDFLILIGDVPQRAPRLITLPHNPFRYAAELYEALRYAERSGARRILMEEPPAGVQWEAVRDRLARASVKN